MVMERDEARRVANAGETPLESLPGLPPEILETICWNLDIVSIINLRAACSVLRRKILVYGSANADARHTLGASLGVVPRICNFKRWQPIQYFDLVVYRMIEAYLWRRVIFKFDFYNILYVINGLIFLVFSTLDHDCDFLDHFQEYAKIGIIIRPRYSGTVFITDKMVIIFTSNQKMQMYFM
jgi:hypothetical protein